MVLIDRRMVLGGLVLGCAAFASDRGGAQPLTVSLLSVLSAAERSDVLSGVNRLDITAKLARLLQEVPDGATVDASMLRGRVRLSSDPFADLIERNVTLRTADVVLLKDFNNGSVILPSRLAWEGDGTELRPLRPIKSIPTDASPAVGMLSTRVLNGHCSGRAGDRAILLAHPSYVAGLRSGSRIAILGIEPDRHLQHRIDSEIDAGSQGFGFLQPVRGTIEGSLVHLQIGEEIVRGTVRGERFRFERSGRGVFETAVARHSPGSVATVMRSAIFTVASVNGLNVILDRPLPRGFSSAQFRAGAIGTSLRGRFTIDGESTRSADSGYFNCLASTLSSGFNAVGPISLRRAQHGGFFGFGCTGANLELGAIEDVGRPGMDLGAGIWLFGSAENNMIVVERVAGGHAAFLIDNKSDGMSYYGLDGPCTGNRLRIRRIEACDLVGGISGSSGNEIRVDYADVGEGSVVIDGSVSQLAVPMQAEGNRLEILRIRRAMQPYGDSLSRNTIRIGNAGI